MALLSNRTAHLKSPAWLMALLFLSQISIASDIDVDIKDPKSRYCAFLAGLGGAVAKGRDKGISKAEQKRQISAMEQINTERLKRDAIEVLDFVYSAGKDSSSKVILKFIYDDWCMGQGW